MSHTPVSDDEPLPGSITPRRALSLPKFDGRFSLTELSEPSSPVYPDTPSLNETAIELRKNLSFKTLADMDAAQWKARLWRPKQPERRPKDLDQLIAWAVRGGTRSFLLAYTARASFNLLVLLLSILRKGATSIRRAVVLHALFGETPVRFGLLFGFFAGSYRFLFHGLRLYNPGPRGPGKEERWHAAAAGALSSMAILAERKASRVPMAQQIFVRGLQGVFHSFRRRGLYIPHGDVLLFGLACGQIMHSFVMSPVALSKDYHNWITKASRMPPRLSAIQRTRAFRQSFPLTDARHVLDTWKEVVPETQAVMTQAIELAEQGINGPPFAPCAFNHPETLSCTGHLVWLWPAVARWAFPVYAGLHFIPPLILRNKAFMANPPKMLQRALTGTVRSTAFLASFVAIYQALICSQRAVWFFLQNYNQKGLAAFVTHHLWTWAFGFATCVSLFLEDKRRREELAVYVLPKAMESAWISLRINRVVPKRIPGGGEMWLSAVGLAMVMDCWRHEREALSSLVRALLWQSAG